MAINSTPGDAAADSYASLADAEIYHASRLFNNEWLLATTSIKQKALKWATIELDRVDWKGDKTTTTQSLRWPRSNVVDSDGNTIDGTIIPNLLKQATAELAFEFIKADRTADPETLGIKKLNVGNGAAAIEFDKADRPTRLPVSVMRMISSLANSSGSGNYTLLVRA